MTLIDFDSDLPVGVFFHTGARYFISENFGFKADVSLGRAGFQNFVLGLYISQEKIKNKTFKYMKKNQNLLISFIFIRYFYHVFRVLQK
ncbi:MAG: hypothetical protein IPH28_19780 [Cytophagaceae bacterium]|nr:hypothetical protein [Cytophagaceae bacterium]